MSRVAKLRESSPPGTGAQTKKVPLGTSTSHPSCLSPATTIFRRASYVRRYRSARSWGPVRAAIPAICTAWKPPESTLVLTAPRRATAARFPTQKPSRQPVMEYVFESEWNSTPTSRALDLEQARRLEAVELELRVHEVVADQDPVAAGEGHHPREEVAGRHGRGGIVGVVQVHELGAAGHLRRDRVEIRQEPVFPPEGHPVHVPAGEPRARGVDGIARVRDKDHVPRVHEGQGDVR